MLSKDEKTAIAFGFRYAITRETSAINIVMDVIQNRINEFDTWMLHQLHSDTFLLSGDTEAALYARAKLSKLLKERGESIYDKHEF